MSAIKTLTHSLFANALALIC